jgi:RNA polymerase sigma factor (sigma-70 family)
LDPLLESYATRDEAAASERLLQNIVEKARPTIESVVRRRLAFSTSAEAQDREDVCGEVVLELLRRLRALRDGESTSAIESFSGYVAAAAHHACDEYLRRKYPQRRRLKNKIRYVLSTEPRFAVWESAAQGSHSREWHCGLRIWQFRDEKRIVLTSEVLQAVYGVAVAGRSRQGVVAMLAGIFDSLQGPILLEELVGIVGRLWGVNDHSMPIDPERAVGSVVPSQESSLAQRCDLELLWNEVRELPVPQRVALLLNLRWGEGDSPILFLPVTGIACIRQIAEVLNIPPEEFSNLWGRLPLDDQAIAARLGVTRQQVINLRKSARERLRRRMADHNTAGVAAGG